MRFEGRYIEKVMLDEGKLSRKRLQNLTRQKRGRARMSKAFV